MLKIGLTGGIGSGKSTVAVLFVQRGIPVIDADRIAHQLCEPGQAGFNAIIEQFGPGFVAVDGRLDRARLRETVFHSAEQKNRLESILHPRIFAAMQTEASVLNTPYCLFSIPLLLETGQQGLVDRVLVIDCSPEQQKLRVRRRDGLTEAMIERILASQCSRQQRLRHADDIICNEGNRADLDKQVEKLHNFYLKCSREMNALANPPSPHPHSDC